MVHTFLKFRFFSELAHSTATVPVSSTTQMWDLLHIQFVGCLLQSSIDDNFGACRRPGDFVDGFELATSGTVLIVDTMEMSF